MSCGLFEYSYIGTYVVKFVCTHYSCLLKQWRLLFISPYFEFVSCPFYTDLCVCVLCVHVCVCMSLCAYMCVQWRPSRLWFTVHVAERLLPSRSLWISCHVRVSAVCPGSSLNGRQSVEHTWLILIYLITLFNIILIATIWKVN